MCVCVCVCVLGYVTGGGAVRSRFGWVTEEEGLLLLVVGLDAGSGAGMMRETAHAGKRLCVM